MNNTEIEHWVPKHIQNKNYSEIPVEGRGSRPVLQIIAVEKVAVCDETW